MKHINNIIICLSILFFTACKKDQVSLDAKEVITITGIESAYTKLSGTDKLTIDPTVTSNKEGAEFEYTWSIYPGSIVAPENIISRTKKLDYLVTQEAKSWFLTFAVTNKKTGFTQYLTSSLGITTSYTRGWYVAKDDGTQTDVDLFLTPGSITPGTKIENVFSKENGKKLDGKANFFRFFDDYQSTVNGAIVATRSLFLLTDKDATVVNINTFKQIHDLNGMYYAAPPTKAPDFISPGSYAIYLINDGQLNNIFTGTTNSGIFGERKLRNNQNSNYHLSKYAITHRARDPYFFDETSSSFVTISGLNTTMTPVTDDPSTQMSGTNNNQKLLYMASNVGSPYQGCAVLQDKTNLTLKKLSIITPDATAFKMVNVNLTTADHIYNASKYSAIYAEESIIYFAEGNKIWSRNLSNQSEQLQYTVPAGEEVTLYKTQHLRWLQ